MNKSDLLKELKLELTKSDNELEMLYAQQKTIKNDIEYWKTSSDALRVIVSRLGLQIHRGEA